MRRGAGRPAHARAPATSSGASTSEPPDGRPRRAVVHRPAPHRGRRSTSRWWSTGGRRSPRRSTAPPAPTRSASRSAGGSRSTRRRASPPTSTSTSTTPTPATWRSGIPDPVLAEIGAARTGAMREIVATIQAEQDVVIRAPIDQALIVQGGPGTGKTAVGLHRAAYLLFEHRRRLVRDGVLVVGPNRVFLDYIGNVLPSLGERSVRQCTATRPVRPQGRHHRASTTTRSARIKGEPRDARRCRAPRRWRRSVRPTTTCVCRSVRARLAFGRDEIAEWIAPGDQRGDPRERATRAPAGHRRSGAACAAPGDDGMWAAGRAAAQGARRRLADAAAGAAGRPAARRRGLGDGRGKRRRWTAADQLLVDEANSMLNGPPFDVRPRRRRRGAGPLGGRPAGDRPSQSVGAGRRSNRRRSPSSATSPSRPRRPVRSGGTTCSLRSPPGAEPPATSPT